MTLPDSPESPLPIGAAVRRVFSKGYRLADLRADILAGTVVGIVAVPLSMALAIAVGVPPQHGLFTAIVAGAVVALLGGCKFQVTGPTAAFVVILTPIVSKHGLAGLLSAGLMAGLILIAMGVARLGSLIRYIPHPVTTGFTTGIAMVIATLQLKDVFGLRVGPMPDHYLGKIAVLWSARSTANARELGVAAITLALLLLVPRVVKKIPAPLIAMGAVSLGVAFLHRVHPDFAVATIGSRFHSIVDGVEIAGIPSTLPSPSWPWGAQGVSFALVQDLFPAAFAIAMLGAIESLLSAVVADGMTHTKHDPNSELVAVGIGNVLAPLFGGIAATGALARTATNIRTGARSPFAAVTHAAVVLLAMRVLAPFVAYVPMASLAGLLLLVAWNMSEIHGFLGVVKIAPKSDVFVLVTCFGLTVFFDMVVAVSVGFVLAAILFMRRMSELTESRFELDASRDGDGSAPLPDGLMVYEINGPLFFGAAQKALATLRTTPGEVFRVLVIRLERVPVIDATGLVALENAISTMLRAKKKVVLAGPLPKPHRIFDKAQLEAKHSGGLFIRANARAAMDLAVSLADAPPSSSRKSTH
ncbi:C4-dicarboxylic acid transporter DauA [Pendulispora rubella]|uniref:C4-dicarboxylic acid transporter DauA n=1 Tax=Pendulispora rubella TaxID=2741070 RepID=A0ABZ2LAQ9_9BACT